MKERLEQDRLFYLEKIMSLKSKTWATVEDLINLQWLEEQFNFIAKELERQGGYYA